jgi:hypothetical protein
MTGYRGFFYHFLDMKTGERFEKIELSTIDTTLLVAGALCAQSYFDRDDPCRGADPRRRRRDLPPDRVDLDPASPARGLDGLDTGGGLPQLQLERLRRGDDPLPPRPGFADARHRSGRVASVVQDVPVGVLLRPGARQLLSPLRTPVLPRLGRFRGIQDAYMRAKGIDYFETPAAPRSPSALTPAPIPPGGRATAPASGASAPATDPSTGH